MTYTGSDLDIRLGDPSSPLANEDLELRMVRDEEGLGHAVLLPRSIKTATPELVSALSEVQHESVTIQVASEALDRLVPAARDAGASWETIGWCVGTTGSAARQRWGAPPAPTTRKGRK